MRRNVARHPKRGHMQAQLAVTRANVQSRPVHLGGTQEWGRLGRKSSIRKDLLRACTSQQASSPTRKTLAVQCQVRRKHHRKKANRAPGTRIPSSQSIIPVLLSVLRPISVLRPMQRARRLLGRCRSKESCRQWPQRLCGIFIQCSTMSPKVKVATQRQRPQRLCGIHTKATKVTKLAQHYGNGRNDYAEFSHEGHQTRRATHHSNGRNDCVESSHDGPTKTRATHTTATAATIMRNFRTVSTQKSQREKSA